MSDIANTGLTPKEYIEYLDKLEGRSEMSDPKNQDFTREDDQRHGTALAKREAGLANAPSGDTALAPHSAPNDFQAQLEAMIPTAGTLQLTDKQKEILYAPVKEEDIEIRPDNLVYLPWMEYVARLRDAFGGEWAIIPQGQPTIKGTFILWGFHLIIGGKLAGFAIGEQEYQPSNATMTWGDCCEGAKSNALMRLCKGIGISLELWRPSFVRAWKEKWADKEWNPKRKNGRGAYDWFKLEKPRQTGEKPKEPEKKDGGAADGVGGSASAASAKPKAQPPPVPPGDPSEAETTDFGIPPCPNCGASMVSRDGKKGTFYGCPKYPKCKGTRNLDDEPCHELNSGIYVDFKEKRVKGGAENTEEEHRAVFKKLLELILAREVPTTKGLTWAEFAMIQEAYQRCDPLTGELMP